jgi:beta-phosphoglucomutase
MIDMPMRVKGCIFSMDGVVVDTSMHHYGAWRRLANEFGFDFSVEQHETLRGLSRLESLEQILQWGGLYLTEAEKLHWADVKNNWYLASIATMKPAEVLPGVLLLLRQIKSEGLKMAISSESRNARTVLRSLQLDGFFDEIIDGSSFRKPKPDPDCFIMAAHSIGLFPAECLIFEDLSKGITAAKRGGFPVVGIGTEEALSGADLVIEGFRGVTFSSVLKRLEAQVAHTV